ncbi:zinc ribbon-containing protein [Halobaculum magnesiiphilum]|uniref:Zinc ribbon-containing protein n=1 Tax=Halobaculum magnesiiphilum TaxID=1017351 RepID=A0A8T8WBB4_9EURY|nr:zinc ribbon-containing protein [Halobaculum magnesiiphilum]QZP37111.1 zinc ribbon-containing protein [Halobaculum magnesiiphilum]
MPPASVLTCDGCGFEAPTGDDAWEHVTDPRLGRLTRCPECGSTNVHNRG